MADFNKSRIKKKYDILETVVGHVFLPTRRNVLTLRSELVKLIETGDAERRLPFSFSGGAMFLCCPETIDSLLGYPFELVVGEWQMLIHEYHDAAKREFEAEENEHKLGPWWHIGEQNALKVYKQKAAFLKYVVENMDDYEA